MDGVISVDSVEISDRAIELEAQNHPAEGAKDALARAAEALVVRELLLGQARRLELVVSPEAAGEQAPEEVLIGALLEQEIKMPRADEPACKRYYENHLEQFKTATQYEVSHILYSASREDEAAFGVAMVKAEETIALLGENPSLFDRLARERSDCPSAVEGGSLGRVERGQTVPEFETFMMNLEEGQLCRVPVKTRHGVHIIRLDRVFEGRQIAFESVRAAIADYLHEASWRQAVSQYIKLLIGQATIKGIQMEGATTPLVQ